MGRIRRILSLLLALFLLGGLTPSPHAAIFKKGGGAVKRIALTFDDGPSKENTDKILSILAQYNVKATFFVIGENAAADPSRIRKIYDAGHEIGNHTYTHAYISKISQKELELEIQKTEEVLSRITGVTPRVFRPPGGYYSDASVEYLENKGYTSVLWSVDTKDWSMPRYEDVVSCVEESAGCGDIILFHDLSDKRLPTPKALEALLPSLIESGYEFVTVSELMEYEAE